MRYADTPTIMDLPNITGQFEAGAVGGLNSPFDLLDPGIPNFAAGQLTFRDTPTLSYHPRGGQEISQTLVNPLNAEVIRVISPGNDMRHFLLMAVNELNEVHNAPLATSLIPRVPDTNTRYREVVDLLVGLQERNAIELRIASFDDERFDPLPVDQVSGADVLLAAKENFRFQMQGDKATLRKREKTIVLRIPPEEFYAPDVVALLNILRLAPGKPLYKVRSEQVDEEDPEGDPEESPPGPPEDDTILVNMRSILDIMVFLSKGVCVPREHFEKGIAPVTCGYDCPVHDWSDVTRDLITIRSQKFRPMHAEVAVPYRGHWYFIDRADVTSRSTLSILSLLLEVQAVDRDQRAPLLTLPLN